MYGQYKVKDASEFMMLGVGQPSPQILSSALPFINYNITDPAILQYGQKQGFESFRDLICRLYRDFANTSVYRDDIYMTGGITQGIFMLASLLKGVSYDTIYVEDLTYFIMINVFKDLGFNIKSFRLNKLDYLRGELEAHPKSIVYIIPFCNNPTGETIRQDRLNEFLGVLQSKTIVFSDETYQFLHYGKNDNNMPLCSHDNRVVSFGTFSKILAPGVRLGWIYSRYILNGESLFEWLDKTGFMDSGGAINPVIGYIITNQIETNFSTYKTFLTNLVDELHKKSDFVISEFKKYPEYFEVTKPDGGFFILIKSKKLNSKNLLNLANTCCLGFHEGNKFSIDKTHLDEFRISISYYSHDDFVIYFPDRLSKLIKEIDSFICDVSVLGSGKLGKLIQNDLSCKFSVLDRKFKRENFGKVIVDVTSPEGTINLINKCYEYNVRPGLIIGTTGHSPEQIEQIKIYSTQAPVVYCSNFSEGIQNLVKVISGLNFKVNSITITDIHHIHKKDAPSGTAKLLQNELKKVYPLTDVQIESVRKGKVIGTHRIILNGTGESIMFRHRALDRDIFAKGCIGLIEKIKEKENGFYNWL